MSNMVRLKIVSMILKPVEIVLLVVGTGFVAYFTKEAHDHVTKDAPPIDPYDLGNFGRYEFFLYTTCVGMGIAVLGFVFAIAGLLEKRYGAFAMFAVQAIWTLQLLVSTALVTKILTTYQKEIDFGILGKRSQCELWDKAEDRDYKYTCGQLTGGVACGFIAMIVFAVDALVSFASFTKAEKSQ